MDIIFQTLSSQSFIQSFLVLLATALLTGLLVPFVKANMDERKLRQQKLFEADLARQGKVIEAQVELLENMAQMLWDFKLLALEVSYYKTYGQDQTKYKASLQ